MAEFLEKSLQDSRKLPIFEAMISFQNLQDSIDFYENHNFKRIEAPWTVTKAISNITKPPHVKDGEGFWTILEKDKVLVSSGEQSFLYLYLKGFLPKGQFQAITPCFRNDLFDSIHTKYFMKNELIETENVNARRLKEIIGLAQNFFQTKLKGLVEVCPTNVNEYDLVYDTGNEKIELGSYGIRSCEYLQWIYATGCAEPRLSHCQQLQIK